MSQAALISEAFEPRGETRETFIAPATFRKVVIHKPGGYERLTLEDVPAPAVGPDDVLVKVAASGVNFADTTVRLGLYASAKELMGWPATPGFEIAGIVVKVGENVKDRQVGERVFGVTLFHGYASHVVVPARQLYRIPDGLTMEQAAAVPAVFLSAWFALFELAHPRKGATVLVHSAAGGVGGSLCQLLKVRGCTVVGVVGGSHKVEAAKNFGADYVIDKSTQDLWAEAERIAPDGYDVILDANGVATLKQSYEHLRPAGKLVVYGFHSMMSHSGRANWLKLASGVLRTPRFHPLQMTQKSRSVLAFNLSYLYDRLDILDEGMQDIVRYLEEGKISPPPLTTYPFERVADAHRDIESGKTVGKLVLVQPE